MHLTPNLEASNAMAGFTFALVNVFCGFLRTYPVSPARAETGCAGGQWSFCQRCVTA